MLAAEPEQPVVGALPELLVGGGGEDQVACRTKALARERCDRDCAGRDLVLHVERPAAPDVPVTQLARPRVDRPLRRVGEHRVGVREQQQPRPVAAPRNPRDEVRPLGHARVQLALDPERLEVVAQQLGRLGLVPRRVDRVQPDELPKEVDDLVAQRGDRHASSRRSRGSSARCEPSRARGRACAGSDCRAARPACPGCRRPRRR